MKVSELFGWIHNLTQEGLWFVCLVRLLIAAFGSGSLKVDVFNTDPELYRLM